MGKRRKGVLKGGVGRRGMIEIGGGGGRWVGNKWRN